MNKLIGDRVKDLEWENDASKPEIRSLQSDVESAESKKLDPRQLDELNRKREQEGREISELHKVTTMLNQKLNDLTNKRDSLTKNINDFESNQRLLEKQRQDEEKRLRREQELAEKREKLNMSTDSDKPKQKKKPKKGDVIDDIVTRFMEENDLKLPFEWKAEGK